MAKDCKEEGEGSNNNRPACAACRHQRRKCKEDCVLAPYFPIEKTQQYLAVHRVFGFSNMTKMLSNLNEQERIEAVMSFEWEALMWQQDPVLGPLGAYKKACDMIRSLLTQQIVPSSEPKLMMGMTHDLSVLNNGGSNDYEALAMALSNNGVPPLTHSWPINNLSEALNSTIGQTSNSAYEKSLVSHSCVNNSFGDVFGNEVEDSKVLNRVAAPNALLLRSSSLLQPNYMPSLTSVVVPDVTPMPSPDMDQQNQMRGFQYYNDNRVNKQMGMLRGGQGTEGNVENIYFDGHGQRRGISQRARTGQEQDDNGVGIPVENFIAANTDNALAHNSVIRSQITDVQHLLLSSSWRWQN